MKVEVFKSSKYFVSANIKAFKLTWLHQRRQRRKKERDGGQHNGKAEFIYLFIILFIYFCLELVLFYLFIIIIFFFRTLFLLQI